MSPLGFVYLGITIGVVGTVTWGIGIIRAIRGQRAVEAAEERLRYEEDQHYRAKMDGIMLDVLIAKGEGVKRARAARWRMAQRRLLLK